jgi:hypothetical protein
MLLMPTDAAAAAAAAVAAPNAADDAYRQCLGQLSSFIESFPQTTGVQSVIRMKN